MVSVSPTERIPCGIRQYALLKHKTIAFIFRGMLRHSSCRQAVTGIETTTEQTPFHPSSATAGDLLWMRVREEARHVLATDPALATLFLASVLNRPSFEDAIIHRIASRLGNDVVPAALIADGLTSAVASDASIGEAFRADIAAVVDRDPACRRFIGPLLYSKGFHAIQAHRLANWLWKIGRSDFALYLQSRSSEVFQTDIHPGLPFGKGIFLTTPPASSSVRRPCWRTISQCSRASRSEGPARKLATAIRRFGTVS
jgi:serine acetyltransferase